MGEKCSLCNMEVSSLAIHKKLNHKNMKTSSVSVLVSMLRGTKFAWYEYFFSNGFGSGHPFFLLLYIYLIFLSFIFTL